MTQIRVKTVEDALKFRMASDAFAEQDIQGNVAGLEVSNQILLQFF